MRYAICYERFKRKKVKQKSTFVNILKDDVTLIFFFCGNHRDNGCKQGWRFILAILSLNFLKKKLFQKKKKYSEASWGRLRKMNIKRIYAFVSLTTSVRQLNLPISIQELPNTMHQSGYVFFE
jgi:hypothetical protein